MPARMTGKLSLPGFYHWRRWSLLAIARTVILIIGFNYGLPCLGSVCTVDGKDIWFWLYPEGDIPWLKFFPALHPVTSAVDALMIAITYALTFMNTLTVGYFVGVFRNIIRRDRGDKPNFSLPIISSEEGTVWPPPPSIPQV